jgi:predicted Holliday junction resolvase-like endonuclease
LNDKIAISAIALLIVLALLCVLFLIIGLRLGALFGRRRERAEWESGKLEGIVRKRLDQSRAVIGGQVSEQIAPILPDFPFDPGDCRFIGKPVDFIVFRGMNGKAISDIVFLEIKSGKSRQLNDQEKRLKEAVEKGRVSWQEFDVLY